MTFQENASGFEQKVVIVTGAARGVGRATALEFSKRGAAVVAVDVLEDKLDEVDGVIQKMGRQVLCLKIDVAKNDQVQKAVKKTIDHFGRIDILVNNAAIVGPNGPIIDLAEEDWERVFQVNLKSIFLFCKYVVPTMLRHKKGTIVNMASIAGKEANEHMGAYSASKAGVICLSRVLAKELAKEGIRVNSIAPALIGTDMVTSVPKPIIDHLLTKIPMGRMGTPEEVAQLILFLSSEKASFITGQCFNITGGRGDY